MRPWKEEVKDLLSVSSGERRGISLLLLLLLLTSSWVAYEQFVAPDVAADRAGLETAWVQLSEPAGSSIDDGKAPRVQPVEQGQVLFDFDPNHLPAEQWIALGLSERQAAVIHRYEARGGHFRTKGDLARMRVVDPELFARWAPFIQLPDPNPAAVASSAHAPEGSPSISTYPPRTGSSVREAGHSPLPVEINSADTNLLVEVRGIGPAFARGIVKYRDRLGGFHDLDQLAEVYILRDKPEALAELRTRLVVDTQLVRRFAVNSFTAEELGPHPYAGWKVAKALVAYRKQHGPFRTVADIKGCVLVTDSIYRKLAPYLSAE